MRDTFIHAILDSTNCSPRYQSGQSLQPFSDRNRPKTVTLNPSGGWERPFTPCICCQEGNPDFIPHIIFSSAGSDEQDSFIHNHSNTRLGFFVWNQVVASCSVFSLLYHLSDSAEKAAWKVLRRTRTRRGKLMAVQKALGDFFRVCPSFCHGKLTIILIWEFWQAQQ